MMNTPLPSLRRLIWLLPFLLIGGLAACKNEKPRPPVSGPKLETRADGLTYKVDENQPFTGTYKSYHKTSNLLVQYPGPKYKKVSFSNPGHARNLARKLNTQFKTDRFTVVLLTAGDRIYP
jgi:hypothetical protein